MVVVLNSVEITVLYVYR